MPIGPCSQSLFYQKGPITMALPVLRSGCFEPWEMDRKASRRKESRPFCIPESKPARGPKVGSSLMAFPCSQVTMGQWITFQFRTLSWDLTTRECRSRPLFRSPNGFGWFLRAVRRNYVLLSHSPFGLPLELRTSQKAVSSRTETFGLEMDKSTSLCLLRSGPVAGPSLIILV